MHVQEIKLLETTQITIKYCFNCPISAYKPNYNLAIFQQNKNCIPQCLNSLRPEQ